MKKLILYFATLAVFMCVVSCVRENSDEIYIFNKYDISGILLEERAISLKVQKINDSLRNIQIIKKDSIYLRFEEFENNKSVYRKFLNKFRTYYSYDSTEKGGTSSILPPFVNMESWLINKKIINIDSQKYEVYHYEELSYCTPSISTYWVKNLGLIAVLFYDGKKEQYYLCDKVEGNGIKNVTIKKISKVIISDSTFFKKANYLPCEL